MFLIAVYYANRNVGFGVCLGVVFLADVGSAANALTDNWKSGFSMKISLNGFSVNTGCRCEKGSEGQAGSISGTRRWVWGGVRERGGVHEENRGSNTKSLNLRDR